MSGIGFTDYWDMGLRLPKVSIIITSRRSASLELSIVANKNAPVLTALLRPVLQTASNIFSNMVFNQGRERLRGSLTHQALGKSPRPLSEFRGKKRIKYSILDVTCTALK